MTLIGFRASNHPQQVDQRGPTRGQLDIFGGEVQ